jgi:hypothetical protein
VGRDTGAGPDHNQKVPRLEEGLWTDVGRIVESSLDDTEGLCAHALGPFAADQLARRGRPVPVPILHQQRVAQLAALTAPMVLARTREALAGPMLVVKGPEVAARYPQPARAYGDLDILVPDSREAQRAMISAGFVEDEDAGGIWVGIHHLSPLRWPGLPLKIELHHEPKWLEGLEPPRREELFEAAVPSAVGVEGVLAPAPPHHALLLAAHAWAHQPLRRARDLVDVGALAAEVEAAELRQLARAWGLGRLWATTIAAVEAFLAGRRTWPLRLWAGHIAEMRVQTVFEEHLERLLSPFWGYPRVKATRLSLGALGEEFRPAFDEGWREKIRRSGAAMRRASSPVTKHRSMLGESAARGQGRNKRHEEAA